MTARSNATAIVPLLLGLPFALLLTLLILNIKPAFGPLEAALSGMAGQVLVLILLLMEIAALIVAGLAVVQASRSGQGFLARPLHLAVAIAALAVLGTFAAAIVIDQYPCWIGVPNCD
jgi:hypothetical protein